MAELVALGIDVSAAAVAAEVVRMPMAPDSQVLVVPRNGAMVVSSWAKIGSASSVRQLLTAAGSFSTHGWAEPDRNPLKVVQPGSVILVDVAVIVERVRTALAGGAQASD